LFGEQRQEAADIVGVFRPGAGQERCLKRRRAAARPVRNQFAVRVDASERPGAGAKQKGAGAERRCGGRKGGRPHPATVTGWPAGGRPSSRRSRGRGGRKPCGNTLQTPSEKVRTRSAARRRIFFGSASSSRMAEASRTSVWSQAQWFLRST